MVLLLLKPACKNVPSRHTAFRKGILKDLAPSWLNTYHPLKGIGVRGYTKILKWECFGLMLFPCGLKYYIVVPRNTETCSKFTYWTFAFYEMSGPIQTETSRKSSMMHVLFVFFSHAVAEFPIKLLFSRSASIIRNISISIFISISASFPDPMRTTNDDDNDNNPNRSDPGSNASRDKRSREGGPHSTRRTNKHAWANMEQLRPNQRGGGPSRNILSLGVLDLGLDPSELLLSKRTI